MGLNCGIVGLPTCGKTVIFNAITAARASSYSGSEMNRVVVSIPDERLKKLEEMYLPLKMVPATLEVVDIPGLKASAQGTGHSSNYLGTSGMSMPYYMWYAVSKMTLSLSNMKQ